LLGLVTWTVYFDRSNPDGAPSESTASTGLYVGTGLMLLGWVAAIVHALTETKGSPAPDEEKRLRWAIVYHRLALGLSATGILLSLAGVAPGATSPAFVVTGFILVAGVVKGTSTRTRKAATALASALDELIVCVEEHGREVLKSDHSPEKLRRASAAFDRAARAGVDSGVGVGWWGVPIVHPTTRDQISKLVRDSYSVAPPASVKLAELLLGDLKRIRKSVERWIDPAA
jgi:hypothetical protein